MEKHSFVHPSQLLCRACGRPIDDHTDAQLSNCGDNLALGQQSTTISTMWRSGAQVMVKDRQRSNIKSILGD